MAKTLELPALGNSMEEGTITRWFKAEGDTVAQGEPLYEVMTDKVNLEVEAPESGILQKILAGEDATIAVHAPVAILAGPGEENPLPASPSEQGEEKEEPPLGLPLREGEEPEKMSAGPLAPPPALRGRLGGGSSRVFVSPRARRTADEFGVDIGLLAGRGTGVDGRIVEADVTAFYEEQQAAKKAQRVSPLAAKVAAAHGVEVAEVAGSGPHGKVTQDDVRRIVEPPAPAPTAPAAGDTVVKLSGMRKMVADAVARSAQTAPHVTLTLAVDMTEATRFRQQVLPAIEKSHGVRVSFTDIIAKAAARALADHPYLNSTLSGSEITLHTRVHIGIAVSLGTAGLIVPVVRDAHQKSLGAFSKALKDLAARAKDGKLATEEVSGGTFSITNLGTFGITQFNPIINPPQTAILGVCAIQDTVVPVGGEAKIRPMMNLCLSFDHRVTDGAPAAAFLAQLKETLEQPYLMFA